MPSSIEEILKEAIQLVEPPPSELRHLQRVSDMVLKMVGDEAEKYPSKPEVVLGGSFAKGTWLKGEADIDIFVKFPEDSADNILEEVGLSLSLKALDKHKPVLRYAEHPYVEAFLDEVRFNIVPCFNVPEGRWKSAADRSPYHTSLIARTFDDLLRREARLLKKFMKVIGAYGAEIKVQGFSGYVCEVLVWKYGSFESVLAAASGFKHRELVSIGEVEENFREVFESPIIILDPIDKRRNLGTAISLEKVGAFVLASRRFLDNADIRYFRGSVRLNAVHELGQSKLLDELVLVAFTHEQRSPDILWGQLKRSLHHIQKQLERRGFKVLRSGCASDDFRNSVFILLLDSHILTNYTTHQGPTIYMKNDLIRFLDKNCNKSIMLWVGNDGRIQALQTRRFGNIGSVLDNLFGQGAKGSGLAPGLKSEIASSYRIYSGRDTLKLAARHEWLAEVMLRIVSTDQFSFGAT